MRFGPNTSSEFVRSYGTVLGIKATEPDELNSKFGNLAKAGTDH